MMLQKKMVVFLVVLIALASCCGSFFLGYAFHSSQQENPYSLLQDDYYNLGREVYVVGHQNPDMDTVCSAIALAELLNKIGVKAVPAVCDEIPLEVEYILHLCNKESPSLLTDARGKQIVMVDHNIFEQGADGLDEADIVGIIDHHSIGGSMTNIPLFTLIEPVGSTATIIYQLYLDSEESIGKDTAGILLAAIIDDTMNLHSSTTTNLDRHVYSNLKNISGITNIDAVYTIITSLETNYERMTDREILEDDMKPFSIEGYSLTISDVKVKGKEEMEKMVTRMNNTLEEVYPEQEADHLYVIVSDIECGTSELLYYGTGTEQAVRAAFSVDSTGRVFFNHVVDRKSDIVPALKTAYKSLIESLSFSK